jgi:uncharacterized oligopeptide transporter (OPT) family protein
MPLASLPAEAPVLPAGSEPAAFTPYVAEAAGLRELTPLPLVLGTILGVIFGASSLYLVLKVGLTVSASIPVAVISLTVFRILSRLGARDATILEHNIVQTAGSAGESIAFGLGVTMPAILILGFDLDAARTILVAVLGGLLGILMMIPLRRALIVQQHGVLLASGYIAGGAIAGIVIAFMAGVLSGFTGRAGQWSAAHNPFVGGTHADALSLLPFAGLVILLTRQAIRREIAGPK